jgi:transcriptional regulator with XRE-family HTH domain
MKLKAYLIEYDLTREKFAEMLGCNKNYLSRVMSGNVQPSRRLLKDIERLTGGVVCMKREEDKIPIPNIYDELENIEF